MEKARVQAVKGKAEDVEWTEPKIALIEIDELMI